MNFRGVYNIRRSATTSTGITIVQIKAVTVGLEVLRVSVTQSDTTSSAQAVIQILRKTAAATVTTFTPVLQGANYPAALAVGSTSGTGITASGEGTDGDILDEQGFNILNGYLWTPTCEAERITVPAGGIVAVKFPSAPTSALYKTLVTFGEFNS